MAQQLTDDELNIRRKQRRRLVGAVALTLAVVVILPMVLDSEPKPAESDIDLRIPDPDNAGEFVTSVKIPEESTLRLPAEPASGTTKPVESTPPVTEAAKPSVTAVKELAAEKIPTKAEPAKTRVAPSQAPKLADKPANINGDSYVAQVGAYSNADTAKQEVAKLKKWGFKAYTEKAGDKIRVRVGPYTTREKAEQVGKMIEKHGLHPVILTAK